MRWVGADWPGGLSTNGGQIWAVELSSLCELWALRTSKYTDFVNLDYFIYHLAIICYG